MNLQLLGYTPHGSGAGPLALHYAVKGADGDAEVRRELINSHIPLFPELV